MSATRRRFARQNKRLPSSAQGVIPEARQLALTLLVDLNRIANLRSYPDKLGHDGDLLRLLGLETMQGDAISANQFIRLLKTEFKQHGGFSGFPSLLERGLERLRATIGLTDVELEILGFVSLVANSSGLDELINEIYGNLTVARLEHMLAEVLDIPRREIHQALSPSGQLERTGLLETDRTGDYQLMLKFDVLDGLLDALFNGGDDIPALLQRYTTPARPGSVTLADAIRQLEADGVVTHEAAKEALADVDSTVARQFGVRGTPSIFINGKRLQGKRTVENYKAQIDAVLKETKDEKKGG